MDHNIDKLLQEAREFKAETREEIENFRIKYLGKKGVLSDLFSSFKQVPAEQKKELGQKINQLKGFIAEKIDSLSQNLEQDEARDDSVDLTLPGEPIQL